MAHDQSADAANKTGEEARADAGRPRGAREKGGRGGQFWAAQILTIVSTVLGVYLAGYVGFQRTLEYDAFLKARQQVNMLRGLETELAANAALLRPLAERMQAANTEGQPINRTDWPSMRYYLWNAAGQTDALFSAPSSLIADMQDFYVEAEVLLDNDTLRDQFRRLSGTNAYERNQAKQRLDRLMRLYEAELSPAIAAALAEPEAMVERYRGRTAAQ